MVLPLVREDRALLLPGVGVGATAAFAALVRDDAVVAGFFESSLLAAFTEPDAGGFTPVADRLSIVAIDFVHTTQSRFPHLLHHSNQFSCMSNLHLLGRIRGRLEQKPGTGSQCLWGLAALRTLTAIRAMTFLVALSAEERP